jgi:transposase-like protein
MVVQELLEAEMSEALAAEKGERMRGIRASRPQFAGTDSHHGLRHEGKMSEKRLRNG